VTVHGDTCFCLACDRGRIADAGIPRQRIGSEADDEASYAYRREGRAAERAAVVAWLREQNSASVSTSIRFDLLTAVIDAIEAGEHEGAGT
jgi:hypothetical protein